MTNKKEDFSVLMSVYGKDNPTFFEAALRSVSVDQYLRPTQIVIVKDGPVSEGIDEVIDKTKRNCADIEITVLNKEDNSGLASALNLGLGLCKYEWVARMDSDDISSTNRFVSQMNYLLSHNEISILGTSTLEFTNEPGDTEGLSRVVRQEHSDIIRMAKKRNPMNHPTVFYKKSAVLSVGGYCEEIGKLEDYRLWVDLIIKGFRFANLNEPLVSMRIGDGFIERRSDKQEIRSWDKLQKYMIANKLINYYEAFRNKFLFRVFVYMPKDIKTFTYKYILRK